MRLLPSLGGNIEKGVKKVYDPYDEQSGPIRQIQLG